MEGSTVQASGGEQQWNFNHGSEQSQGLPQYVPMEETPMEWHGGSSETYHTTDVGNGTQGVTLDETQMEWSGEDSEASRAMGLEGGVFGCILDADKQESYESYEGTFHDGPAEGQLPGGGDAQASSSSMAMAAQPLVWPSGILVAPGGQVWNLSETPMDETLNTLDAQVREDDRSPEEGEMQSTIQEESTETVLDESIPCGQQCSDHNWEMWMASLDELAGISGNPSAGAGEVEEPRTSTQDRNCGGDGGSDSSRGGDLGREVELVEEHQKWLYEDSELWRDAQNQWPPISPTVGPSDTEEQDDTTEGTCGLLRAHMAVYGETGDTELSTQENVAEQEEEGLESLARHLEANWAQLQNRDRDDQGVSTPVQRHRRGVQEELLSQAAQ